MRAAGRDGALRAVALGLVVVSPIALRALEIGHPEELLCAVLCVAALLVAGDRRTVLAGLLLGLAVATKAWALVAVGPVLLAAPEGRRAHRAASPPWSPPPSTRPSWPSRRTRSRPPRRPPTPGVIFQPWQAGWFLGDHSGVVRSINGAKPGYRTPPPGCRAISHPLIVLGAFALSALWWRRRRGAGWSEALLLLALLLHLRCLFDTFNTVYYCLPFLLALVTWEALATRRPPRARPSAVDRRGLADLRGGAGHA